MTSSSKCKVITVKVIIKLANLKFIHSYHQQSIANTNKDVMAKMACCTAKKSSWAKVLSNAQNL